MKQLKLAGIPVTPSEYQMLKFVLTNEYQAHPNIKPTKQDIKEIIDSGRKPSPKLRKDMADLSRLMDKSYRENEK